MPAPAPDRAPSARPGAHGARPPAAAGPKDLGFPRGGWASAGMDSGCQGTTREPGTTAPVGQRPGPRPTTGRVWAAWLSASHSPGPGAAQWGRGLGLLGRYRKACPLPRAAVAGALAPCPARPPAFQGEEQPIPNWGQSTFCCVQATPPGRAVPLDPSGKAVGCIVIC